MRARSRCFPLASTLWWVEARDKNFLLRQQLDQGINPALERKKEKERIKETVQEEKRIAKGEAHPLSLEAVALDWLEEVRKTWKPRSYKAVRHDAVRMCGLIVSSGREFFSRLGPEETRRFFEESKAFLTDFVGTGNVISAMVHMDEKTPHMHFLHVPVINGRLNAKGMYTRDSLKRLQTEFYRHLHSKGFDIQRGVEQEPGSKKKHLDTREFKQ